MRLATTMVEQGAAAVAEVMDFPAIVRLRQGMVFSIAYHFLRDRALAEEVAQEVFLQLHQSVEEMKSGAHVGFWLRRVASHRAIDCSLRITKSV